MENRKATIELIWIADSSIRSAENKLKAELIEGDRVTLISTGEQGHTENELSSKSRAIRQWL